MKIFKRTLLALLIAGQAGAALGEEAKKQPDYLPWDRVAVSFGGFVSTFDSNIRLGTEGAGVSIDAEELLGLDSRLTVLRLDALCRIGKNRRHRIDFTYGSYNRNATKTLTQEIEVDGEILLPGTDIESIFDFDLIRSSYTYSFFQDERMNLGAGLGVYVAPIRYGINITEVGDTRELEIRDITLPLPALSLRGDFQIVPRLFLVTTLDFMYLKINDFSGSLMDWRVGLEYQLFKHFGLGVAYNSFDISVEADGGSGEVLGQTLLGEVQVDMSGLLLYGTLTF